MSKNVQILVSFLILAAAIFWSFYGSKPFMDILGDRPAHEFSTARAMSHVEALSKKPHYVGSKSHRQARNYIVSELESMGLLVHTQEALSVNKYGVVTRPENIISRIEGSGEGKALLLLSHYDSAIHSSYGASDAASGVATILEGVRTYLASGEKPLNDIVLLFSDAEELGLHGAGIFVEEHPWAEDIGLALNFEARGSGGDSFMLLETSNGNKKLIQGFQKAGVNFAVSNSLAYSVYKMLPNDTDLTVLREQGGISGFNFAFIDDHFDYHTATDLPENLDPRSLAHQGSYLIPLLNYFSQTSLENLESEKNLLFFSVPGLGVISYPYAWILPMVILAALLFLAVVGAGIYFGSLDPVKLLKSFLPLIISLILGGSLAFGLWKLLLSMYPQYLEMEQGFTYNGYYYITAILFFSMTICFYTYHTFRRSANAAELFVAPLFFWILIGVLSAIYLKGAAYLVILVFFGLVELIILLQRPRYSLLLLTVLSIPAIFLLLQFSVRFPVALGLGALYLTGILAVLLWILLWPVFSYYRKLQLTGFFSFFVFLILFMLAHSKSEFSPEHPRPNSLVYLRDVERDLSTWNSYDHSLGAWNAAFFEGASDLAVLEPRFHSKYGTSFSHTAVAPKIQIPEPVVKIERKVAQDPKVDAYGIKIIPGRDSNRLEIFTDRAIDFASFKVNGKEAPLLQPGESDLHVLKNRWTDRLLEYYPVTQDTLRLDLTVEKGKHPELTIYEAAHELLSHPQLRVPERTTAMIPRPFVLNDAVVVKKTVTLK